MVATVAPWSATLLPYQPGGQSGQGKRNWGFKVWRSGVLDHGVVRMDCHMRSRYLFNSFHESSFITATIPLFLCIFSSMRGEVIWRT